MTAIRSILQNIIKIYEKSLFNSFMTGAVIIPLICSANQWTGFYMIMTPVMKELIKCLSTLILSSQNFRVDLERVILLKKTFGALLTNSSKVFDCLSHGLLITKLDAYRFSFEALKIVEDYLSNGKCHISIPLENVSKPKVFWRFQGVYKCYTGLKWVKFMRGNFIWKSLKKRF